jgi:hypothetical protein
VAFWAAQFDIVEERLSALVKVGNMPCCFMFWLGGVE